MKHCINCDQPALPAIFASGGRCRWHWVAHRWGNAFAAGHYGPEPQPNPKGKP